MKLFSKKLPKALRLRLTVISYLAVKRAAARVAVGHVKLRAILALAQQGCWGAAAGVVDRMTY